MPHMEPLARLRANMESVFFGQKQAVTHVLVGLVARGHVLVEDAPGVGKTVLARSRAKSVNCDFKPGPIFANIILADEISCTYPRTQSALLEAMNDYSVTIDGKTMPLPNPFMVIATQNPFEFEGTYLLPENQLDRFLIRIELGYPERECEKDILKQQPGRFKIEHLDPVMSTQEVQALQGQANQ